MATIDSPTQPGTSQEVDPTFKAARTSLRPLDYVQYVNGVPGRVLGHYAGTANAGNIATAANANLAYLRNPDPSALVVVLRFAISLNVVTAITAQSMTPVFLSVVRGMSILPTTNINNYTAAIADTGKASRTMGTSFVLSQQGGLGVATAAAGFSGQNGTSDSLSLSHQQIGSLTTIGQATPMLELYKADKNYSHPLILRYQEAVLCQWGTAAIATGTVNPNIIFEWAEVAVF